MVFHHPPFLFFHFPHQQKRPVQRRAKLPPFCPQFVHALFELAAFLLKIKPQLYRNGNDLILISRHDSSSQPLICEPAFQFQASTPEEAGETLRPSCPQASVLVTAKPPTGRFCWFLFNGSFLRGLFSCKSPGRNWGN